MTKENGLEMEHHKCLIDLGISINAVKDEIGILVHVSLDKQGCSRFEVLPYLNYTPPSGLCYG
jgi:hypothetical protein